METMENLADMEDRELTELIMSAALVKLKRGFGEENEKIRKIVKLQSLEETIYKGNDEYPTQVDLDIEGIGEDGKLIWVTLTNTRISSALSMG